MHGLLEIFDGPDEIAGLAAILIKQRGDVGVGGQVWIPFSDDGFSGGYSVVDDGVR